MPYNTAYTTLGGDVMRLKRLIVLTLCCAVFTLFFMENRGFCGDGTSWAPVLDVVVKDDLVYVVTAERGGLYGLKDKRWDNLGGALPSSNLYSLSVSPKGHLFLAAYDEALFSKDRGRSWSSLKGGGRVKNVFPTSDGTFILIDWHRGILLFDGISPKPKKAQVQGGDFLVTGFSENPEGSFLMSTFGGGVLRSDDGGSSWYPFNQGLENLFVLSITWSDGDRFYIGTMEGGVFVLEQGVWSKIDGLPEGSIVQVVKSNSDGVLYAGTLNGAFVRSEKDGVWTHFPLVEGEEVSVRSIAFYGDGVLVGTGNNGLFYLDWDKKSSRPVMRSDSVVSMVFEEEKGKVLALSRSGRLFSSLDGNGWSEIAVLPEGRYSSLVRSSQVIMAGASGKIYASSDGETWTGRLFPRKEFEDDSVVAMVESNGAFIVGLSKGGLFRSVDSGVSWSKIDSVEGNYVYSLQSQGSVVAVGTDRGFSLSHDGGITWRSHYVTYGVGSMFLDDRYLWGSSRNGLWRWTLDDLKLDVPVIEGFKWSPFNYFSDIFPGREGEFLGLIRGGLVRVSPSSEGKYVLNSSSLSNNDRILSAVALPDRLIISTKRGFYSSSDGGLSWSLLSLPVEVK